MTAIRTLLCLSSAATIFPRAVRCVANDNNKHGLSDSDN